MISRLRVNPILKSLLEETPDVFVYLECQIFKSMASIIPLYSLFLHKAKRNTTRRGIAIFFKKEHIHNFSLDRTSNKYDIVWVRYQKRALHPPQKILVILCFFYVPGDSHSPSMRSEFFDELRNGFDGIWL